MSASFFRPIVSGGQEKRRDVTHVISFIPVGKVCYKVDSECRCLAASVRFHVNAIDPGAQSSEVLSRGRPYGHATSVKRLLLFSENEYNIAAASQ